MKICMLADRMKIGYGVDLVVDQTARRLVDCGFEVTVAVLHADIVQPPRNYRLTVVSRIMPIGDIESEASMKQILSRCKIDADLWILHTPPFYTWAKYLDGPVIAVEHGTPPGHFFSAGVGRHIDATAETRMSDIYRHLRPNDAIVSISQSIHEWLPTNVQKFSTVIHHGGDHYARVDRQEARQLRPSLGIGDDECLILWVGRMQLDNDEQPYKGFQEVLSLIPFVQQQVKHARFVLAGRVSDRDRRRLEGAGHIVLANQTSEQLARAYAAADVLLNLSKWEGFNLALLEAQFQGTPVVAYDLGPHPEIVRHGETGLLAGSPRELYRHVIQIATDPKLRESFGRQAAVFARDFTWDAAVGKLANLVAKCTSPSELRDEAASGRVVTARNLLKLDDLAFVRAARAAVLGQSSDEAADVSWLRELRRGLDKRTVLLEMVDFAAAYGIDRRVPGLRPRLVLPRARRGVRRLKAGVRGLKRRPSIWLQLQEEVFVQHAYRVLLGREAEPEAVAGWAPRLRAGHSRVALLAQIRNSDEGRNRPCHDPEVLRLLGVAPARRLTFPDPIRSAGQRSSEIIADLVSLVRPPPSSEWFTIDAEEFVRRAYRVLLGREAEQEAVEGWAAQLLAGLSRQSLLATIRFSEEGRGRPVQDVWLRRVLFADGLRRSPALGWLLRRSGDAGREDIERQIRRIENAQRSLKADLERIEHLLQTMAPEGRLVGSALERFHASGSSGVAGHAGPDHLAPAAIATPATMNFGQHVVLVAPGAFLEPTALSSLQQAAEAGPSDIILGDEWERLDKPPFRRFRINGPFSHDAFLRRPDLGGVIAVRRDLLESLDFPPTLALTGRAVLQLVSRAHTISHLPTILCERATRDLTLNLPTMADIRSYMTSLDRRSIIAGNATAGFDVRFPVDREWKAAIVIVCPPDQGELDEALASLRAKTPSHRYHLVLVRAGDETGRFDKACSKVDKDQTVLRFSKGMPYGRMVNEAIDRAPKDCNLVVAMNAGVAPTAADWLERLAELALTPSIGVVAPKTLYPDGRIRHAGMSIGLGEGPSYIARFVDSSAHDDVCHEVDIDRLNGLREVPVVSGHCMMFRRAVLQEQGWLADDMHAEACDIDFCCRLRDASLSIIVDGRVTMVQSDVAPRWERTIPPDDLATLKTRYGHFFAGADPFWTPSRAAGDAAAAVSRMRTVRLPVLEDR